MPHHRDTLAMLMLGLVALATIANTLPHREPGPGLTHVVDVAGTLAVRVDARCYEDKPLEVTLPRGTYDELVLMPARAEVPTPLSGATLRAMPGATVLLHLERGDPRLVGGPDRIELPPWDELVNPYTRGRVADPLWLYVKATDGRFGLTRIHP